MELLKKRNSDFMDAVNRCIELYTVQGRKPSLRFAVRKALEQRAPSFYLSTPYVWRQLHERVFMLPANEKPIRTRMWQELEQAYRQRRAMHLRETPWESLDFMLATYSPSSFFISEEYAHRLTKILLREHDRN